MPHNLIAAHNDRMARVKYHRVKAFFINCTYLTVSFGSIVAGLLAVHYQILPYRYGLNLISGTLFIGLLFAMSVEAKLKVQQLEADIVVAMSSLSLLALLFAHYLMQPHYVFLVLLVFTFPLIVSHIYRKYYHHSRFNKRLKAHLIRFFKVPGEHWE